MKIICTNEMLNLDINKSVFVDWVRNALLEKKSSILPEKTSMKLFNGEGFVNVMPAILPNEDVYGVKVVCRNPKLTPTLKSTITIFDLNTSNLISLIEADYITAYRTGACAVLSIETLAVKGYKTIGLIGLGNICRATIKVLLSVVTKRKLKFKLFLYNGMDNGIISILKGYDNVEIELCDDIYNTVHESDVVISCVTYAKEELAKPEWFKKGCLLVPVHTRGFLDCDKVFDRVIVDDFNHVRGFKNFSLFKNNYELSNVLENPVLGRQNNEERIIAYNIGIAILDIFFAKKMLDFFPNKSDENEFETKLDKYWVD